MDKASLRRRCLEVRAGIAPAYAKQAETALAQQMAGVLRQAGIVAGYRAIRGEINPQAALERLAAYCTLCLPVIGRPGAALAFRRWDIGAALDKDAYGIEAPQENADIMMPDAVIVPLVAFDAAGHRLGYGAGYYDRTIAALRAQNPSVRIIGVAFAAQEVESIPAEEHDEKLDMAVTEQGVVRFT